MYFAAFPRYIPTSVPAQAGGQAGRKAGGQAGGRAGRQAGIECRSMYFIIIQWMLQGTACRNCPGIRAEGGGEVNLIPTC